MRRIVVVSIGLLLLVGCGPKNAKGTLSGTIKYKGLPVNGATLHLFTPGGKEGNDIEVPVAQDGTFSVADVPAGDYKVIVVGSPGTAGPSTKGMTPEQLAKMQGSLDKMKQEKTIDFPDKYKQKDKTDLTCTVVKGANEKVDWELKD